MEFVCIFLHLLHSAILIIPSHTASPREQTLQFATNMDGYGYHVCFSCVLCILSSSSYLRIFLSRSGQKSAFEEAQETNMVGMDIIFFFCFFDLRSHPKQSHDFQAVSLYNCTMCKLNNAPWRQKDPETTKLKGILRGTHGGGYNLGLPIVDLHSVGWVFRAPSWTLCSPACCLGCGVCRSRPLQAKPLGSTLFWGKGWWVGEWLLLHPFNQDRLEVKWKFALQPPLY